MEQQFYEEMISNLDSMIARQDLCGRKIFLFGYCEASEKMLQYLFENEIMAEAFLDNNVSKQGICVSEIPVQAPETILRYAGCDTAVLIASRAYEAMVQQLQKLGYDGRIYKVIDYNSFAEYSLSRETMDRKWKRMQRGVVLLGRIKKACHGRFLVICPYNALGDVYMAMAYLPYYLEEKCIFDHVMVTVGETCTQVVNMFSKKRVVTLGRQEMDELTQAVIYTEEKNAIIAHHDRPYTNDMTLFIDKGKLSFRDLYCCGVFGLERNTEPVIPCFCKEYMERGKMKKDKSIILSPYAKSVIGVPMSFWEANIEKYVGLGFQVYTNVVGQERPLAGTEPVQIPISQIVSAVEYAGHFIGIRSGLCDVLSSAKCKKTVVYKETFYSTTKVKISDFFALAGWNQIIL